MGMAQALEEPYVCVAPPSLLAPWGLRAGASSKGLPPLTHLDYLTGGDTLWGIPKHSLLSIYRGFLLHTSPQQPVLSTQAQSL